MEQSAQLVDPQMIIEWEKQFREPQDEVITVWGDGHPFWTAHTLGRKIHGPVGIWTMPTGRLTGSGDPLFVTTRELTIHSVDGLPLVVIPPGVMWDGASIPAIGIVRRIIGQPMGMFALAALIHDWLYQSQYIPRRCADRMFLLLMDDLGIVGWRRTAMWAAVRLAGRKAWIDDRGPGPKQLLAAYWQCDPAEVSRRLAMMSGWAAPFLEGDE